MKIRFLFKHLKPYSLISAPLISLFFLMNGMGLMLIFMPIHLESLDISNTYIGLITACYYLGMGIGAFTNTTLILRVGHIRAFSALATLITCAVLFNAIFNESIWYWAFFRGITGFCLAGLYIVIESWILKAGTPKTRGRFLAMYMIALFGASATGQLLLNFSTFDPLISFLIVCILVSFSIFPLSVTKVGTPIIEEPDGLGFKKLFKLSSTGLIACITAGFVYASVIGFIPLYINTQTENVSGTAFMMFLVLLGAMMMQYPVGKISDHVDRRKVMLALFIMILVISMILFSITNINQYIFYLIIFLFGGASASIYPLSISHTCDVLSQEQIIAATQGLLLAYCIGSVTGPLITPLFIDLFGINGLFIYFGSISLCLCIYLLYNIKKAPPTSQEDHQDFALMPGTTPVAAELDPRAEE